MQLDTYGQQTQVLSQGANRVLRNTYMLLALTMVPTVAGALLGVQMQFSFMAGSPFIAFMLRMILDTVITSAPQVSPQVPPKSVNCWWR